MEGRLVGRKGDRERKRVLEWSPRLALHAVVKFAVSSVLLRSRCMQHLDASLVLYTLGTMYLSHVSAAVLPLCLPHESAIALIK